MTAETERAMTASEKVDALEESQHREFNQRFAKSVLYTLGEQDPSRPDRGPMPPGSSDPSALALQGDDPRLQKMPERPTLLDFFKYRVGFIRSDHGYWGEQLVKPYVDEEVSWAIRAHQVLRFYADESVGYTYPEMYIRLFGEDFKPEPYVEAEYKRCLDHKWYMTGRQITINDIYSFDPDAKVNIEDFYDIIGRNFH